MRDVECSGNCCAHAPLGPLSRIPSQTFAPCAISAPAVVKQRSVASAGLLPATPAPGFARMFAIHSSITASASGVCRSALPDARP